MKTYILGIFLLSIATSSVFAEIEGRVTHPLPGDPLIDFRIEKCNATKGFGSLAYYMGDVGYVASLTDFCFDEENGKVTSMETRDGFTLVEKSHNGKVLEIIGSSDAQELRTKVRFLKADCAPDVSDGVFFTYHNFLSENKFSIPSARGVGGLGYTIPSQSSKMVESAKIETKTVLMTLVYASQAQLPKQTTQVLPDGGQFTGTLSVSGNAGTFSITGSAGTHTRDANGLVEFEIGADGEVIMTGQVTAKNQRLAGHKPGEWISMTAEIPYIRGHLLGTKRDQQIRAFGLAIGTLEDIDGNTHDFRAQVRFQSCLFIE